MRITPRSPDVLVDVTDGVAVITLNRPEKLNAFDGAMAENLLATVEAVAADASVRVVVLTGAGRGFCAGGDLTQIAGSPAASSAVASSLATTRSRVAQKDGIRRLAVMAELLHDMPKPTIAAVNGPCAGAGMSLACAVDLRYAARSALFTTAFARAGQSGDYGLAWTLGRLLGAARARELLLLAERVSAEDAYRLGLVSRVVNDERLLPLVRQIAETLAAIAPITLAAIKANLSDGEHLSFAAYLDHEAQRFANILQTADSREAAIAFREKRAPRFVGGEC